eukprot:Nitzschia sp. Nitz4//scaffold38_size140716//129009//130408//NITZ4_003175-RA/size140716-processed-gene-0.53-mRNA-1//1//CDS//3329550162//1850//frame0
MGLFKRASKQHHDEEPPPEEAGGPPSASASEVLKSPNNVVCTVRDHYKWLLEEALENRENVVFVENVTDLPSAQIFQESVDEIPATPTSSRRRSRKKPVNNSPLRLEVQDPNNEILLAIHASSEAFDGIVDKDELVRTLQRCRADHLEISPPSRLVNWDVTKEECMNVVGSEMPTLLGTKAKGAEHVAVLKEPMGSRGTGIFFVRNAEEIHSIVEEHRKAAVEDPNFLTDLIALKGRIPSWVLQAEIRPCMLIRGRRKFHIRTYVVGLERLDTEELIETYVYARHEVRIALEAVQDDDGDNRDRAAHIIDGAYSQDDGRALLEDVPELESFSSKIETFVAKIFAQHLVNDISRRVGRSASESPGSPARKFALAGLDIMVTEDKRLYLLEVNLNPMLPPAEAVGEKFRNHLVGFMGDLVGLVVGAKTPNFKASSAILAKKT